MRSGDASFKIRREAVLQNTIVLVPCSKTLAKEKKSGAGIERNCNYLAHPEEQAKPKGLLLDNCPSFPTSTSNCYSG